MFFFGETKKILKIFGKFLWSQASVELGNLWIQSFPLHGEAVLDNYA